MGPFAGKFQGQVVVKFQGAPAEAIAMTGPYGGSVVVPEGSETGLCTIEMDGRQLFGTNCVVSPTGPLPQARPQEPRSAPSWKGVRTYQSGFGDTPTIPRWAWLAGLGLAAWWLWGRR